MKKIAIRNLLITAAIGLVNTRRQAYSILELQDGASDEDIKRAFRQKALKLHPDVNKSGDDTDMKMLIAARDFLLSNKEDLSEEEVYEDVVPVNKESPYDLSYEDIADLRNQMGREEFNRKFQGWEDELKREMGLDEWNKIFERYDPNYNPYEDLDYQNQMDIIWERLEGIAYDEANVLYDKAKSDGILTFYTRATDLLERYPIEFDKFLTKYSKDFLKLLEEKFNNLIFENVDEFDLTLEDVLAYPNKEVVVSFFSKQEEMPDLPEKAFANDSFMQQLIWLLYKHTDIGEKLFKKYMYNTDFIKGLINQKGYFWWFKGNEEAKNIFRSVNFDENQRKIVDRYMR